MSDSLIEQVKRLAEAQKAIPEGAQLEGTMYGTVDAAYFVQQASAFDFPALLAHLERTQAVVDALKARRAWCGYGMRDLSDAEQKKQHANHLEMVRLDSALDAALENMENNDGK